MAITTNSGTSELSTSIVLESIEQFSAQLARATDLETLYGAGADLVGHILDFDCTILLLQGEKNGQMNVRGTAGVPDTLSTDHLCRLKEGLAEVVMQSGKIEVVEDFTTEPWEKTADALAGAGMVSAIGAPLKVADLIIGVLIGYTRKKRSFTEEERQLYQVLASHTAIAIHNYTLIHSLSTSEKKRERKIAELEVEKEKNRALTDEFEIIFATIDTGVMLLRDSGEIVRCNEKFADIFGYESSRKMQKVDIRQLHLTEERYREFGKEYSSTLIAGGTVQTDYTMRKRDGTPILCRLSGRAVDQSIPPDLNKGFVWIVDDITRRKELEEEIFQARKLESIGILAGGIGHDFNNILSAILGNLGLAQRLLESDNNVQEMLASAIEAGNRAKELTAKLLIFVRSESSSARSVYLPDIFKEYNFERMLSGGIELRANFQQDLFPLKVKPDNLKAILQNLLMNADGSMEEGVIAVTGHNVEVLDGNNPGLMPGKYVEITVADNGGGIEEDVLEHIFDPYFTTKNRDSSRGSGLGLAIVHAIVRKNNGNITVRSNREDGTVFTVYLPASIDSGVVY